MKIGLSIAYLTPAHDGKFFLELLDKFLSFDPYTFTKKYTTYQWDPKKHRKMIEKSNAMDTLMLSDRKDNIFLMMQTGGVKVPTQYVQIVQDAGIFLPTDSQVHILFNQETFIVAYKYHEDYETIQSAYHSSKLKNREFTEELWDSIKHTPWKSDGLGGIRYSIEDNPGKLEIISGAVLLPAWKMWFGSRFFNLVPKERILAFPNAFKIEELQSGIVHVQLFEKLEESASSENMRLQHQWRNWLDFDGLKEKYK